MVSNMQLALCTQVLPEKMPELLAAPGLIAKLKLSTRMSTGGEANFSFSFYPRIFLQSVSPSLQGVVATSWWEGLAAVFS